MTEHPRHRTCFPRLPEVWDSRPRRSSRGDCSKPMASGCRAACLNRLFAANRHFPAVHSMKDWPPDMQAKRILQTRHMRNTPQKSSGVLPGLSGGFRCEWGGHLLKNAKRLVYTSPVLTNGKYFFRLAYGLKQPTRGQKRRDGVRETKAGLEFFESFFAIQAGTRSCLSRLAADLPQWDESECRARPTRKVY